MYHKIIVDKCNKCGRCYENCPLPDSAIVVNEGQYIIVPEMCCDCDNCINVCEASAIEII